MRWKLFATLSEAAGSKEVDISVSADQPTLRDAFEELLDSHPELAAEILDEDGSLHSHIMLLCDGEDPFRDGDGWETSLATTTELALLPPLSGG